MFIISTEMTDKKVQKMNFHSDDKGLDMLSSLFLFLHKVHSGKPDIVVSKGNKVL